MIALSVLLLFFVASILLFTGALQRAMLEALEAEPDFVVQRVQGERIVPMPVSIGEALIEIPGTRHTAGRIWGRYRFPGTQQTVLVMGIDFLDEQAHDALHRLMQTIDLNHFMRQRRQMIVGRGVADWMARTGSGDRLRFFTPDGDPVDLKRFGTLPEALNLFGDDVVITHLKTARTLLGLRRNTVTDFTFDVPNEAEWETVPVKVSAIESDLRIVSKKESRKAYWELFDYRSGFFLVAFGMAALAFMMLLSQRYSTLYAGERRSIGVLRAIGWSVGDVLAMKFYESAVWVVLTFVLGYALAWMYVFGWGAPGLAAVFFGGGIRPLPLVPRFDLFEVSTVFLLYALPFFAASLLPIWRTATTPPAEAMR